MKYVFVDTDNGGTPSNTTPDTSTSKYHTTSTLPATGARWVSLNAVLADATICGITDDVTIYCQGATNDTAAVLTSSMTCASLTISGNVVSPVWDNTKYSIVYAGASNTPVQLQGASIGGSIVFEKIQIELNGTGTSPSCVYLAPSVNNQTHTIRNNIVRMTSAARTAATASGTGILVAGAATGITLNCHNNIVYDIGSSGTGSAFGLRGNTTNAATINAYNNVVSNLTPGGATGRGISANSGDTLTVKNCAVFSCADDVLNADTLAYCATDDEGTANNCINALTWTNQFEDYINGDFRLKAGSSLIGAGIGPSSDANVPTPDIAGVTRSGTTTDIGAAMFVSGGLTITSVNTTNTAFSAQTNSAVIGTGLSASVVCTYAGIACTNESASSSTSLKITFPNFFTNNIKLGRNYEFKVVG